jgi:hypothetical protein
MIDTPAASLVCKKICKDDEINSSNFVILAVALATKTSLG